MKLNKCWIEKRTDVRSSFASFILGAFAFVYVRLQCGHKPQRENIYLWKYQQLKTYSG